ncbi:MAG: C10 family peptidase [Alistipes sp.]|nr:C10 family peptidase [Alistipes sp.]
MKRIFILAAACLVACAESDDLLVNETNAVKENPYEISIESAMQTLETMFPEMMRTTRVGASEVKTLRRSDLGMATRADDADPQAPIAYIIPLANNGCAIMGADVRQERLYAALESTTLTPDDIARAFQQQQTTRSSNATDNEGTDGEFEQIDDIKEFAAGLIANSISGDIQFPPEDSLPTGVIEIPTRLEIVATDTVEQLLNTKWHQGYPFNMRQGLHPRTGNPIPAGCGPIALAQVINYHKYPNSYNETIFDWNLLPYLHFPYPRIGVSEYAENAGADLAYATREILNFAHDTITSVKFWQVKNSMFRIGYQNVIQSLSMSVNAIRQKLDERCCVFMTGSRRNGDGSKIGHIWLADGYRIYQYNHITILNSLYFSEDKFYAHYNLGWGGDCDGYYLLGAIDLRTPIDEIFVNDSIGDFAITKNAYYNIELGTITYDRNR